MFLIKRGTIKNQTAFLSSFEKLSKDLKTGLIPREKQESLGKETISPISLDTLMLHVGIAALITMGGYLIANWGSGYLGAVAIPAFSVAYILGLIGKKLFEVTKANKYMDPKIFEHINGLATDLLVGFGIASISLIVVANNVLPLSLLFIFGIIYCLVFFKFAPKFFQEYAFEKGIFVWGKITGTAAMGIALLRVVDPKFKSKTLDDFSMAYLPEVPIEVAVITFAPAMLMLGHSWTFVGLAIGYGILVLIISRVSGFIPNK